MGFTKLTEDVAYIQKLGDNPNSDNGLTSAALKAWFDKAPEAIKAYLNNTFIPEIETKFGSLDDWITEAEEKINNFAIGTGFLPLDGGLEMQGNLNMDGFKVKNLADPVDDGDAVPKSYATTMKVTTATLSASGWSSGSQTVSVDGVLADKNKQAVITTAAAASLETYLDANINCSGQGDGTLTFSCEDTPSAAITVNVLILTKGG